MKKTTLVHLGKNYKCPYSEQKKEQKNILEIKNRV